MNSALHGLHWLHWPPVRVTERQGDQKEINKYLSLTCECIQVWSEWLERPEERMMYAEITTDTETIVMTTRTVLIGRGRWSRPTIWQLMLAPQQYLHHHHIPITNTRKYQVLPRNYIPASLNTPQFLVAFRLLWTGMRFVFQPAILKKKIQHIIFWFVFITRLIYHLIINGWFIHSVIKSLHHYLYEISFIPSLNLFD